MEIGIEEIQESIKVHFPELKIITVDGSKHIIVGALQVNHIYNDFPVNEAFDIEIEIPEEYPYAIPIVKETGNKISRLYPHIYSDGRFCLGIDGEMMLKCRGVMNLKYLINTYVVPYLFSYRYYERFNVYPFGDRSHGSRGILESYVECLRVDNAKQVYSVLRYAVEHIYRGHLLCPCNSGKRIRNCHGEVLRLIIDNKIVRETILKDLDTVKRS